MRKCVLTERESEIKADDELFARHMKEIHMEIQQVTVDRRASSDPLYLECPGAAHPSPDEILINRNEDAGTIGTAVHEVLADWLMDPTPNDNLDVYIQKYNLSPSNAKEVKILAAIGRIFWHEWDVPDDAEVIPERPNDPGFEQIIDGVKYTGHTDILIKTSNTIFVLDWKTTRLEYKNYQPQLTRYCWHVSKKYPEIENFQYVIIFLRDQIVDIGQPMKRQELEDYHDHYVQVVEKWDGKTYNPGPNCHYCPRTLGCPAKIKFMQNMLAIFNKQDPAEIIAQCSDAQCVGLYKKIGAVQGEMEEAKTNIKQRCMAMDNMALEGDAGVDLVISPTIRQEFDLVLARPALLKFLEPEQIDDCCRLSKTSFLDAISAKAPRGKKKEMKQIVMHSLEQAKCITETVQYRIGLKKSIRTIESKDIS
jgi:hypothetical protein